MAEINHYVATETTEQTYNTDTNYTDVSANAKIASSNFTAGRKYLIVVTAHTRISHLDQLMGIRLVHGSTAFSDSEEIVETNTADRHQSYQWFTVWTAVASEDIKLQHKTFNTSYTVKTDLVKIVAIEISEDLTENTDWFYNEDTDDEVIPTDGSWETANNATVTFTPGTASQDWLVLGTARYTTTDLARQLETRLARSGEATETVPLVSVEGENSSDAYLHMVARVYNLGASSNTFQIESRNESGSAVSTTRTGNQVFALNLAKFKNHEFFYNASEVALAATAFGNNTHTDTITPTVEGDVWAFAYFVNDVNGTDGGVNLRLQVDNSDDPAGQTTDAHDVYRRYDTTDEFDGALQTVANVTTGGSTFDVDMNRVGATASIQDRLLVLVTMELDSAVTTVTKTFTVDAVIKNTVTKTFTVDSVIGTLNNLKTFTIDSIIRKLDSLKTFTIDSVIKQIGITKTFTVDTIIKALDRTKTFTIDSIIKTLDVTKTFTIDTHITNTSVLTKTFTIDSVIKMNDVLKTFTVDAIIRTNDQLKTFTIDSVIRRTSQLKTFTIDSVIKAFARLKTFTIDVVFSGGAPSVATKIINGNVTVSPIINGNTTVRPIIVDSITVKTILVENVTV